MTSAYEGWGLTLTEAQQMGCVPIVFDSFSAVHDIIKSGENGLLIPNNDLDSYVSALVGLMLNEQLRKEMERQALRTSKAFALQEVIKEWGNLLSELPTQYV
jgi:glycosyltransferase involved in cell wall biosynthesis